MRREALAQWRGPFGLDSFAWVVPPVLNGCTRVAVEMCPVRGILRAVGYERTECQKIVELATLPSCLKLQLGFRLGKWTGLRHRSSCVTCVVA
jgi:hypothetical protein